MGSEMCIRDRQGTTAIVEYDSEGEAPALITLSLNRSTNQWEVKVTILKSRSFLYITTLEEYLNTLDDVAKAADAFRNALNKNHRPQGR